MVRARRRLPAGARQRAALTVERLAGAYPDAHTELVASDPWRLLVAVILSAQTTDQQVNRVTPELFRRFPAAAALAGASQEDVEEIVRPTGFYRSKARAIREMSQDLVRSHGGEVPARMEDLVRLRGVGRKTANVVLGVAFHVPGFAVDTHVLRLTHRLRLTSATEPDKVEQDVCSMVAPEAWTNLSLRLILHGRRVCLARAPRCMDCVLNDFCPSSYLCGQPKRRAPASR